MIFVGTLCFMSQMLLSSEKCRILVHFIGRKILLNLIKYQYWFFFCFLNMYFRTWLKNVKIYWKKTNKLKRKINTFKMIWKNPKKEIEEWNKKGKRSLKRVGKNQSKGLLTFHSKFFFMWIFYDVMMLLLLTNSNCNSKSCFSVELQNYRPSLLHNQCVFYYVFVLVTKQRK